MNRVECDLLVYPVTLVLCREKMKAVPDGDPALHVPDLPLPDLGAPLGTPKPLKIQIPGLIQALGISVSSR